MKTLAFGLSLLFLATSVLAGGNGKNDASDSPPEAVITTHKITIGGKKIEYRAIAGYTRIQNNRMQPIADVFTVSYLRDGTNSSKRPVTFVFNGGPGSSSVWLHLGLFGPKRVVVPSNAEDDGAAPFTLATNDYSLLDVTDLVMVDPVGTGFSRPVGNANGTDFWGLTQDADSLANFIRRWLTENKRWNSPKYLAGESYGTTRAAMLAEALHNGYDDVALNGVMLISSVLDFRTMRPAPHNDDAAVSYLPTYAATAWYHGKVAGESNLEAFLDKAREFALTDYAVALHKGNRLSDSERLNVRKQLAHFTGISERYLEMTDLYIQPDRFMKELLRYQGVVVGRLDSRYLGKDFDEAGETFDADPSAYGISAAYTAAINDYLTNELNMVSDRHYEILSSQINREWDWTLGSRFGGSHVNVAPKLGQELRQNKHFRIFIANGYYDLATPFFGTENSFAKTGMPPQNVTFKYYQAGHMMYVHEPSLKQLAGDIRGFIGQANQ